MYKWKKFIVVDAKIKKSKINYICVIIFYIILYINE